MDESVRQRATRSSQWSAILTLLGFLVVTASIGYSAIRLNSVHEEVKKKRLELDEMSVELKGLQEEVLTKQDELRKANKGLGELYAKMTSVRDKVERGEYKEATEEIDESTKPRVYIYSKFPLKLLEEIGEELKRNDFVVQNVEVPHQDTISKPHVGYFRDNERAEAERILDIIKSKFGIDEIEVVHLAQYDTSRAARPRQYEIWLGDISADNIASKSATDERVWDWTVFIKAPDFILDRVRAVEYHLHETFRNPIRTIDRRGNGPYAFALTSSGWGTFQIKIYVHMKSGRTFELTHFLRFGNLEQFRNPSLRMKK